MVARPSRRPRSSVSQRIIGPPPLSTVALVHVVQAIGNAFFTVSLAGSLFFSVSVDAARPRIVLYLLVTLAPFAVIAPFVAPFVDRIFGGYRALVVAVFTGKVLLSIFLAVNLRTLLFFPGALGILVFGKTYAVAKNALVPRLVPEPAGLVPANARLARLGIVGGGLGGAVAAGVLRLSDAPVVVLVGALVYAAAALLALRVPQTTPVPRQAGDIALEELHAPAIVEAAMTMAILRGGVGFSTFFLGFELKRAGSSAWVYGAVLAAAGVGGLLGTVLAPAMRQRLSEEAMLGVAVTVPCVLSLVAALRVTPATMGLVALSLGLGSNVGRHAFDALVQRRAPDPERGRAFAMFEARFQLGWVVGALAPVVARPNVSLGFVMLGVGLGAGGVIYELGDRSLRRTRSRHLPLPYSLLAAARVHLISGAPHTAAVVAATAVEVAAHRFGREPADSGELWEQVWARREAAVRGDLEEAAAADAVRCATAAVDALFAAQAAVTPEGRPEERSPSA